MAERARNPKRRGNEELVGEDALDAIRDACDPISPPSSRRRMETDDPGAENCKKVPH